MNNKSFIKLLTSPITKLKCTQIRRIKQLRPNKNDFPCARLNSDTVFLKSTTVTNLSSVQKHPSNGSNEVCANGFSTSKNHSFWNKLTDYDQQQFQEPSQRNADTTEVEPLLLEGVGWAGQPVVRRTHPILPEVYGEPSDIFGAVEKLSGNKKPLEEPLMFSKSGVGNEIVPDNAEPRSVNLDGKERATESVPPENECWVSPNKTKEDKEVKMSLMNEKTTSGTPQQSKEADPISTKNVVVKDVSETKRVSKPHVTQVGLKSKEDKRLKKLENMYLKSGHVLTKQKKKNKKKAKASSDKIKPPLKMKTKIKPNEKNTLSMFGDNKNRNLQTNILLSQRESPHPVKKSFITLANRLLQTYSHANQAKVAIKEKFSSTIIALSKKQKQGSKLEIEGKYPEDCKCPETLETKTRFPTKICGEAAGAQEKKKKFKERKGKMCPIEHQLKHRRRTFVCNSAKFAKGKRKRQLPKCEKPEKKIAQRSIICPPVLEDELKKGEKKKCVKQVEEVKIRSKTKVCKPIITHEVEVKAKVVVQKAACTEKKVKKTISRHTTICIPPEGSSTKKESKR